MKKEDKKQQGFSLIEMLVVIFIVGLISATLIVNWRKNEKRYQLQRAAQEIVQLIRQAQGFALNGKQMLWSPTGEWLVPGYYGVHLRKNNPTFFIYGDVIGNAGYQSPEDIEETYGLIETGIEIDSFGGGNDLDVIFNVPDGFIDFYPSGTSAVITIKRTGSTCPSVNCKTINIRAMGQISVD
jgi:prepilin-type N-terminal cleavage/methylation domain-containing protein